jgi:hypothetical protein
MKKVKKEFSDRYHNYILMMMLYKIFLDKIIQLTGIGDENFCWVAVC